MRILTYKQTHTGDPSSLALWGETGCMGQIRNPPYDAVIGVGGIGVEPRTLEIDRRITWIGVGGQPVEVDADGNHIVLFSNFKHWGKRGPMLSDLAPKLADRIYGGKVRHLSVDYTPAEQREAEGIVEWFLSRGRRQLNGKRVPMPRAHASYPALGDCPPTPPTSCPPSCPRP